MKTCRVIFYSIAVMAYCVFTSAPVCSAQTLSAVNVSLVTDEAEAVLNILAKKAADQPITDEDWKRVFQSEGYIRLKKRELAMKNSFEDDDFKTFVLSDKLLERKQALEETLDRWKRADRKSTRLNSSHIL